MKSIPAPAERFGHVHTLASAAMSAPAVAARKRSRALVRRRNYAAALVQTKAHVMTVRGHDRRDRRRRLVLAEARIQLRFQKSPTTAHAPPPHREVLRLHAADRLIHVRRASVRCRRMAGEHEDVETVRFPRGDRRRRSSSRSPRGGDNRAKRPIQQRVGLLEAGQA